MIIPTLQGTCTQTNFFIYAACDVKYFDEFGHEFIASVKQNTNAGVHIHLFNPRQDQINYCIESNVSVTWEEVPLNLFGAAAKTKLDTTQHDRTLNAMSKGKDRSLVERMQKTYYACARFIRLEELFTGSTEVLELDIDAVVRKNIEPFDKTYDFYIHQITGKKARFLAGGLYLNPSINGKQFLQEYTSKLKSYIEQDYIYWGLDQDLLDPIVPKYKHSQLPMSYIDWNMQPASHVWTAKGTRKELAVFINEQKKYKF